MYKASTRRVFHLTCKLLLSKSASFTQLPSTSDDEVENNARNAAIKERLEPNLEGLTLAGYMREPTKIISKAVGLFSLDPIVEEEGERGSSEELDVEQGGVNEDVFEKQEEEEEGNDEQKQEGWCLSKPPVLGAVLNVPCVIL